MKMKYLPLAAAVMIAVTGSVSAPVGAAQAAIGAGNCQYDPSTHQAGTAQVYIWWHTGNNKSIIHCMRDNGSTWNPETVGVTSWLDKIVSHDHEVQYKGNGQWLPQGWINKHTVYGFPNHPGGVQFSEIRIRG